MTEFAWRTLSRNHCSRMVSVVGSGLVIRADSSLLLVEVMWVLNELEVDETVSWGISTSAIVATARWLASWPPAGLPWGPRKPSATASRLNGRGGGARLTHRPCTTN